MASESRARTRWYCVWLKARYFVKPWLQVGSEAVGEVRIWTGFVSVLDKVEARWRRWRTDVLESEESKSEE